MTDRETFLDALRVNEDDESTRRIYANWLEEQGEYEEAERQRQWAQAKAWLVRFCREHNPVPTDRYYDEFERVISYETILELGRKAVRDGNLGFSCGNNMKMCDGLREHSREFWRNWSIVTGIPLPSDSSDGEMGHFRCAC